MPARAPALRGALDALRARGEPVPLETLASELLALTSPLAPELARPLVAAILERPAAALPEHLAPRELRPTQELGSDGQALARARFAVVDLETTGVAKTASILEIGAVLISGLRVVDRFQTLVRPPHPVPEAIVELTGIGADLLQGAPAPGSALRAFARWLAAAPDAPFVAHNAQFDASFVARDLERHGLPPLGVPVLCTRKLARRIAPEIGRYNLDHLCAHFGISNAARHRALGDAAATGEALIELLQLAGERLGLETVGELLDLQKKRPPRASKRKAPVRGRGTVARRGSSDA